LTITITIYLLQFGPSVCAKGHRQVVTGSERFTSLIVGTQKHDVVFHGCSVMTCTGLRFHSGCSTKFP